MYCFSAALTFADHRVSPFLTPTPYALVGEALADHLELALVLGSGREPGEDHVVGGHRVDLALGQGGDAVGELRVLPQLDLALVCSLT